MISTSELMDYMLKIGLMASSELVGMNEKIPQSNFIIPQKRDESYRLSEQEFRVTCINAIQGYKSPDFDLYFSVETPSTQTHMISGSTPMSARFDISLYERINDTFNRVANIELKARNAKIDSINKDLHKLIKEANTGAWFHVLQNCDSGTFKSLFRKFVVSLEGLTKTEGLGLKPTKDILFAFLVANQRLMISKILSPSQLANPSHCFRIDYKQMLESPNKQEVDGWLISRF